MLNWLTGKVALYVCGILLALVASLSIGLWVRGVQLESARNAAQKWYQVAGSWKKAADTFKQAGVSWRDAGKTLEAKLEHANRENLRVAKEGAAAVAAAEAKLAKAQQDFEDFDGRFQRRSLTCKQALSAMEASCSELSDY